MKRLLLLLLVWLIPWLAHAQVYDTAYDCKPVITGTASGVSVWTEFGATGPCFFWDVKQKSVTAGIQTSSGAVSGSPVYETVNGVVMAKLGTGASIYAYWNLPTSPVGGSMFAESLGAERVQQSDFESSYDNWATYGSLVTSGITTAQAHSGSTSYYIHTDSSTEGIQHSGSPISLVSGHLYKLSAWVYQTNVGNRVTIRVYDSVRGFLCSIPAPNIYNTWVNAVGYLKPTGTLTTTTIFVVSYDSNVKAFIDDVSAKEVLNGYGENSFDNLYPPHGTAMIDFRPGYNASDMTGVTQAVLDLSGDTIFQVYASGVTCYDGTTGATVAYTPVMDKTVRLVAKWGYLVSNVAKFRVGIIQNNQPISWGIEQNFDGAFSVGSQLRALTSPWGRAHVGQPTFWPRILTDAELNMMGSP